MLGGKNVIIIGGAGTGKSTLLMQIAAFFETDGHKILMNSPSIAKAKHIQTKLDNQKALIMVDNFADEMESFDFLSSCKGIQLLGSDRHHNFEMSSHLVDLGQFEIISVSDLTEMDVQEIYKTLPPQIRKPRIVYQQKNETTPPSLFEFVNYNMIGPTINERIKSVIDELETFDENLVDLLLMVAYCSACRTFVSFEMCMSFFDDIGLDYKEISNLLTRLKSLVVTYSGNLVEEDQDYFAPRSQIFSETVIKEAKSLQLRRMLRRFHENVPRYRIPYYHNFRRRAYDADFITQAFGKWEEGKSFYEMVISQGNSDAFLVQQGALYLSRKRIFNEAFNWIDKALHLSKFRSFTIRNSHAIILFSANIDKDGADPNVKQSLEKSMEILKQCRVEDSRKLFHTITYGNQALKYYSKYSSERAKDYLNTATSWADQDIKTYHWDKKLKFLKNDLRRALEHI